MEDHFRYNQIPMFGPNRKKTSFMIEQVNYQYNMIPFGLENACAAYQKMMNNVFREEISGTLEVYIYDMIVKATQEESHY